MRANYNEIAAELEACEAALMAARVCSDEWNALVRRSNELRIKLLVAENPPEEQKEAFPSIKVIV